MLGGPAFPSKFDRLLHVALIRNLDYRDVFTVFDDRNYRNAIIV